MKQVINNKSKNILRLKGKDWKLKDPKEQEEWIEVAFKYWRRRGFPYYKLDKSDIIQEFRHVAQSDASKIFLGNEIQMSMVGLRLVNYFHPQMWDVLVGNCRSPLNCFNDDESLRACIRKALTIWPNRYSVNESCLRSILKTFRHTAGVSNFRPTVAKAIYEIFSSNGDRILDFSAGFGGRLLGCLPLKREYIGLDPSKKQVDGLNRMIKKMKQYSLGEANAFIFQACAEDFIPNIESESLDLIFSSPPYFNKERYTKEPTQSYIKYPTYSQWLTLFLERVIEQSYLKLRRNRYFILNIANIKEYRLGQDALNISKRFFKHIKTLKMRLGYVPYKRGNLSHAYKYEPIYVFYKN